MLAARESLRQRFGLPGAFIIMGLLTLAQIGCSRYTVPIGQPSTVPTTAMPAPAPAIPAPKTVDACGVNDPANVGISMGQRATLHLANGQEQSYCSTTGSDFDPSSELSRWTTVLGAMPDPTSLLDSDGKPLQYLGSQNFALTWQKADGSLLVLPALYPKNIEAESTLTADVAPVMVWKGASDPRSISGWQLQLVDVNDGKPVLTLPAPFVSVDQAHTIALSPGSATDYQDIPPHYELVGKIGAGGQGPGNGQQVGLPLRIKTLFDPVGASVATHGFLSIQGRSFRMATAILPGSADPVSVLSDLPLESFVDDRGQPLTLIGIRGNTFTWGKSDGTSVAVPALYPATYNGVAVGAVLLCPVCTDPTRLSDWQVWLVDINTGAKVTAIEHPLVALDKDESIALDYDTAYLEVAKQDLEEFAFTGRQVGLQLPTIAPAGTIQDIPFYKFPTEDVSRFQSMLTWLQQVSPKWYAYVMQGRPFDIIWAPELISQNVAGEAHCCWTSGTRANIAWIEFSPHPPLNSADPAANLGFASVLIHEVTHVMDRRANRFNSGSVADCRAYERSATEAQESFLNDILQSSSDPNLRGIAQYVLSTLDQTLQQGTFSVHPACRDR